MPSINSPSESFDVMLAAIDRAAHESAFGIGKQRPSDATCHAGNYKVGRVTWKGLPICIEQPHGSVRSKTSKTTGAAWQTTMAAHYGYIQGTKGADGDAVDCFVGARPDSDTVYVVNQGFRGKFDEHKVMLCFGSEQEARNAYMGSYMLGWDGLQSIVAMTLNQFRWWIKFAHLDRPADPKTLPYNPNESAAMKPTAWDGEALPVGGNLDQLIYDIRRDDGTDGLLLDSATVAEILADPENESVLQLDALVTPFKLLDKRMGLLRAAMDRVSGVTVKTVAMQVSDPFKQRGTAQVAVVYELSDGQSISVYLHNPDSDPGKINPDDELVSWKWMLNKKDLTIVVAPEQGKDLNVREVARRLMRLADKNSAAFARANANRAARLSAIDGLQTEVGALQSELSAAQKDLELAQLEWDEFEFARIEAEKKKAQDPTAPQDDPLVLAMVDSARAADGLIARIATSDYFTFSYEGDEVVVGDELRAQVEAALGEPLVEATLPGLEAQVSLVAKSKAPAVQEPEKKSDKWWDSEVAAKYAAVYLIGKSRGSEYVTLEAKGNDYDAKATQSGIQQSKTGTAQEVYEWLASQVLTGMGHAMQGKSLSAEEMTAKLKLVKGTDILAVAKPAKVKAVTKKEAREAYESLEWCLNHRLEYGNASLAKLANVGEGEILGYLQACEDLIARGLPEMPAHMNMQKLVDRVRAIMEKVKVAKARASGDFGGLDTLIENVVKELVELGWNITGDGKANTNPDEETDGGRWAVESPRGTEVVMSPDDRMLDEIDFNGSFDYIARVGDDAATVARGIDQKDWAENSEESESNDDGIVDDEDSEFFGKTLEFVRANVELEKAVIAAGAELIWGDFTASLHTGSLFDGATHFGVSAQIGKAGQVAARASISDGGFVTLYVGPTGDAVALESMSYKAIAAKVVELVSALPERAPDPVPEPQPEPESKVEPAQGADTPVARLDALLKAKPKGEIRSDDPQAIPKLQAKLAYLEGYSELMRTANKLVRKDDRAGLAAMGFKEKTIDGLFAKDFAGRVGFPDYELKNTNAEARRTRQRLEQLQREAQANEPMQEPENTTASTEYRYALVNRPAGPGAIPKDGFLRVDPATPDIASTARHGVAVYSRELTEQELKSFEIRRLHTESERAEAVEKLAQHFAGHEYAANYYEYVQEGDLRMLEASIQQEMWQQYPFDTFPDMDGMPKEAGERFAKLMQEKQPANDGRITVDGYTYEMDTSDGFMVTFVAPETVRGLKLWAREEDAINAKIQAAIDMAKTSPHLAKRWNSTRGEVTHVALSNMPTMGEGSETYDVVYANGQVMRLTGNNFDETMRKEAYEATPEGAAAVEAARVKYEAEQQAIRERRESAEKAAAARKQDLDSQIDEWLSKTSYTPVQKGSARAILSKEAIYPEFDNAQLARVEFVQRVVDKGGKPYVEQVNRIKDKTRLQWNRMDNNEQREHERKVREGGTVAEYSLGNYIVTKTEYDYANYLMGKKEPAQESQSADPERTAALQYLQGIADGKTDPLTVDFDNLEALFEKHGSDAEIAALFEKAADVVSNAALAATA